MAQVKKANGMTGKVHHRRVPGTKLSEWEYKYVLFYCADPSKTNAQILSAMNYPGNPNGYAFAGSRMWRKKAVQEAIRERMQDMLKRLDLDTFKVLQRLKDIAFTNADEVMEYENGKLKIKDFSKIKTSAKAIIASIDYRPGKRGAAIRVRLREPMPALDTFLKILGLKNTVQLAVSEPHKLQKEAIRAVRSKTKSVIEACLDLEEAGVPIPQTLLILLNRQASEMPEEEGPIVIPTPQEQAAKAKERMREITEQRTCFLPERREQIARIKKEMKSKGQDDYLAKS